MFTVARFSRLAGFSWRFLRSALAALLALLLILLLGLSAWDADPSLAPDRLLLPGVQLNLRTAMTSLGPVEYDLYGARGPVVLSLHGGFGGADQGRLFASWLQGRGFRILSPSRPGYLGTPLESGRTYEQQADLLAALLDSLGIERVALLSYSAGSPVAYTFAARHPDRLWALVSIDGLSRPQPGDVSVSPLQTAFMNSLGNKLVRLFAQADLGAFLEGTLNETSTFSPEQKQARRLYILSSPERRRFFEALLGTTFPYDLRTPGDENDRVQSASLASLPLVAIRTPTLVVHGTQDADVPFAHGEYAHGQIPGARSYWLEAEDHLGFWLGPTSGEAQDFVLAFLLQHAPLSQTD